MSIEAGTYKARATGHCVLGESKNKGTPFIELYFSIVGGPNNGAQVRWSSYFTDTPGKDKMTVSDRTIKAMQVMGWKGDDLSEFSDGELHGLGDNEVSIVVDLESYENDEGETKTVPRVQWVNSAQGYLNVEQSMSKAAAAQFAQRLRGRVHALKGKGPVVDAPANQGKGESDVNSDEIPF
jgi:hypothetical protein